ncbi:CRISPR-associated protein Cmr6 [Nocardiopsis sp. Huas11]|uniref:type III-B CRISPR module RAMP protein Cmr6 n=1 Tax=Nocardiopsis sp. Huas11 TaxID=2183912 RepID=UPI000F10905F|nr:type III-B CRISPR module RAMP protein Cmr6 [Nocardiopsis sp. Huas11]RKS07011.1 CRISPR-associated protein Cmr6 [Nocardiopsis sp. Huas11]
MAKNKNNKKDKGGKATPRAASGKARGPFGRAVRTTHNSAEKRHDLVLGPQQTPVDQGANALVVLRRLTLAPRKSPQDWNDKNPDRPLHAWAGLHGLGQQDNGLAPDVLARRTAFLQAWRRAHRPLPAVPGPGSDGVLRLQLSTEWRIAPGLGLRFGAQETGASLHGTYGWPLLSASALKGLAAAAASAQKVDDDLIRQVLGGPRPGRKQTEGTVGRGGVRFLDALVVDGLCVHEDVITPHQQPYYTTNGPQARSNRTRRLPGEHHNPVPVEFLSVSGTFAVDLLGLDPAHLRLAASWLRWAGDEIGGGGRTTAGYGYFTDHTPAPAQETL